MDHIKIMKLTFILIILLTISTSQDYFLDITDDTETGVWRPQYSFFGAGVTMADFDQDGNMDIFVPTPSGDLLKVFRNLGNETFEEVSEDIGLEYENNESIQVLVADYDNDGYEDIFIINWVEYSNLYHNDGDNTFTKVNESSGINVYFESSRAASWLDYDRDGDLDLYMVNRVQEELNILYRNNGDGTFNDVTEEAGVNGHIDKMGLVVIAFDYNNDLWPDIYIGNDMDLGNIFYKNNGDGTFTDVSVESGMDLNFSSMGLAAGDYDHNGFLDIYVTNLDSGNGMMRNNGDGTFTNVAEELNLLVNLICWGTNFIDFDNDGHIDLQTAAGCISGTANNGTLGCSWNGPVTDPLPANNTLFKNIGYGQFQDVSGESGLDNPYLTTGTAIGDINNDGYIDLYEVNELDPTQLGNYCRLYKNNYSEIESNQMNWIKVKLEGVQSNRNGIGSRVEVVIDDIIQIQDVICGDSYSSQSSLILSFGARNYEVIDSIAIKWPSGIIDTFNNIPVNQILSVIEGSGDNLSGDLNQDTLIDILDILLMINMIFGNEEYNEVADLNDDNSLDIFDILMLVNIILAQ